MKYLLVLSLFLLNACAVVGPGELGVRVTLGTVSQDAKPPGVYLWFPFVVGLAKMDTQIQRSDIESTAATKDMQDVHAHVAVNWSITPERAVKTYQEIGHEGYVLERIIIPAVNEVMKSTTSKRTAEEVLTKRMEMKADIDLGLNERLAQYGVKLYDVSIVNLKFSEGFTHAIEAKQIAEQAAQEASYVAQKATQEAKADIERAKGQATAQTLMRSTITAQLLQQRAIEKWNGVFPTVMGTGALPFINMTLPKNDQ